MHEAMEEHKGNDLRSLKSKVTSLNWHNLLMVSVFLYIGVCVPIPHEASATSKRPIIIITVDVETSYMKEAAISLPEQIDAICSEDQRCGLQEMVHMLKKSGYAATFFLNPYEYEEYGESVLSSLAKWLDESGQDVQLHTHPQWSYDKNRNLMQDYSLEEQIQIVKHGKELIETWNGDKVIAHRAGAYGADENTLKALIENNIYLDTSLFCDPPFGLSNARINNLGLKKNAISTYGPLYEFPVTVYKTAESPPLLDNYLKPISRIRKYDINWFRDSAQTRKAMEKAVEMEMDFVILFLHSYSFIAGRNKKGEFESDTGAIFRFQKILHFLKSNQLEVTTFKVIDRNRATLNQYLHRPDIIPEVVFKVSSTDYLRRRVGINRSNFKTIGVFFVFAVLFAASITFVVYKRRSSNA